MLGRCWLAIPAWLGILVGGPASAGSPGALACAIQAAPAGLDGRLADALVAQQPDGPAMRDLRVIVDRCGDDQFLGEKARDAYFGYAMGRLARDVLGDRLRAAHIAPEVIDEALDIGPGNANNPADEVTQGDLRRVEIALADHGTSPATVAPATWGNITAYIGATAAMFEGQRKLE